MMWIILCCCGGVRVGEASHPGPGFDDSDPEEVDVESNIAWSGQEDTMDQL